MAAWQYARWQWKQAQLALQYDHPEVARDRLAVCLRAWPRSPEVQVLAARAARLTLDLPAAEAHLDRARQLQGGSSEAVQLEYLLLRVQSGEVDEVVPTLIDLVEAGHPERSLILETVSRAYMHHLRYTAAYGSLSRWADLQPDNVKPYHWRAWVLERLNNHKASMLDYLKVLELDPNQLPARLRVAEMLLDDKQVVEAMPHLEYLARQAPDDPRVKARLGAALQLQGQLAEARPLLEDAVIHMPGDAAVVVALSSLDVAEGRGAAAEERLKKFLATEPSDTEALFVLSSAQRVQGKQAEAARTLDEYNRRAKLVTRANELLKVADAPATTPDELAELGSHLIAIGREKLGVYWLTRALDRDPDLQPAHRALTNYYERTGDAAQALFHRRQLRDPAPPPAAPPSPSR